MNSNEIATKGDIDKVIRLIIDLDKKLSSPENVKTYSINELVKLSVIGKYTRIRSLINKGIIKSLPDGRILKSEVDNYLANKTEK